MYKTYDVVNWELQFIVIKSQPSTSFTTLASSKLQNQKRLTIKFPKLQSFQYKSTLWQSQTVQLCWMEYFPPNRFLKCSNRFWFSLFLSSCLRYSQSYWFQWIRPNDTSPQHCDIYWSDSILYRCHFDCKHQPIRTPVFISVQQNAINHAVTKETILIDFLPCSRSRFDAFHSAHNRSCKPSEQQTPLSYERRSCTAEHCINFRCWKSQVIFFEANPSLFANIAAQMFRIDLSTSTNRILSPLANQLRCELICTRSFNLFLVWKWRKMKLPEIDDAHARDSGRRSMM